MGKHMTLVRLCGILGVDLLLARGRVIELVVGSRFWVQCIHCEAVGFQAEVVGSRNPNWTQWENSRRQKSLRQARPRWHAGYVSDEARVRAAWEIQTGM
jgi:hypothetical protein